MGDGISSSISPSVGTRDLTASQCRPAKAARSPFHAVYWGTTPTTNVAPPLMMGCIYDSHSVFRLQASLVDRREGWIFIPLPDRVSGAVGGSSESVAR